MMVGSVMVAACFLTMGWASEIVGLIITDEARVSLGKLLRVGVARLNDC